MKKGALFVLGMLGWVGGGLSETVAYWRFDATSDGSLDLRNAAGPHACCEVRRGGPVSSFRQPLAVLPAWNRLPPATRGGQRNAGSFLFEGQRRKGYLCVRDLGSVLDLSRSFTVEGWIRPAGVLRPDEVWTLCGAHDAQGNGWTLSIRNQAGKAAFYLRTHMPANGLNEDRRFDPAGLTDAFGWAHVALVYEAGRNTEKGAWHLFVDGAPRGVLINAGPVSKPCIFSEFDLGGNSDGQVFDGEFDLWRVSAEALASGRFLLSDVPQTLAYWPLDVLSDGQLDLENKAGSAFSLCPGKDGGLVASRECAVAEVPNPGALRHGVRVERANTGCAALAGDIGRRSLLSAPDLGMRCDLTTPFTVEGWYRKTTDPAERFWYLAGARDDASGWMLALGPSHGRVRFQLHVSDVAQGGGIQFERFFQNSDVTGDTAWRHVALVYDPRRGGIGMWELFIDGMSRGVIANPTAPDRSHGFRNFNLGGRDSLSNSFVGNLDCWRVSDGALAPEQFLCSLPDAGPRTVRPSFRDPRNIARGAVIPDEHYCDQPYIGVMRDGSWVCVLTTGRGAEGDAGQHVVSTVSKDQGHTWSPLVDIEPASGPEASWATCLVTPFDRIYAFYTYNGDNVTTLPGQTNRVKSAWHGWYAFKYSDDGGQTWSSDRFRVPIRVTDADRSNPWHGKQCHFWGIDKPVVADGAVFFAFTKLARWMPAEGEGWVVASDNILTERNPSRIHFNLLPEGEKGIRNPAFGPVQEEHNLAVLKGQELMCVCRTEAFPAQSFSRDGARTWSMPERMTYAPGGRPVKSNRACPKLFRTQDGRYLFWYHHHGVPGWENRNPVFLTGGLLKEDGFIHWSQPELLFYDQDVRHGISYPDMVEQNGRFWFTETQKSVARVHEVDRSLLEGLWHQASCRTVCRKGWVAEVSHTNDTPVSFPSPASFGDLANGGLTVELWLNLEQTMSGETLFTTVVNRRGVRVSTARLQDEPTVQIELFDGDLRAVWQSDPGLLKSHQLHHVVFICDFAPGIVDVVFDGVFCDGGDKRPFGWGRVLTNLGPVATSAPATIDAGVKRVRLYNRALRISESVGNYHAGAF